MKNTIARLIFLPLVLLLCSSAGYASQTYTLDSGHTFVLWHINHFGFSNPTGKWFANGTLVIDEKNPKNSKVDVTIDMAAIDTGIPKLDEHLKSATFFDTNQFPTATFVSDKVTMTGKKTAKVRGKLTFHGVSNPVTLDVTLNKMGTNPISEKKSIGFSAKAMIKRSEFGMSTLLPGLGDEVKLEIEAEGAAV
jgi:polyisoprenoid-binding protein YceI